MSKLTDMTLEELWELFPIELTEHRDAWHAQYEDMEARLSALLRSRKLARISHIGSTAVKGIWAKPIVDVLVEISEDEDIDAVGRLLEADGFIKMNGGNDRISLNMGYTEDGFAEQVYHIHVHYLGDNDELYFRDYLREHPEAAKEYEVLKLNLWHRFEHDRDAYTEAKGDFVKRITAEAKAAYAGRY